MGEYAELELERCMDMLDVFGHEFFAGGRLRNRRDRSPPHERDYFTRDHDGDPIVACAPCGDRARLVTGMEVYRRDDLASKLFWVCPTCGDRVGCHPGTNEPLGYLADAPTRALRSRVHAAFDPAWRKGMLSRHDAYEWLADAMGIDMRVCHFGMMDAQQLEEALQLCYRKWPMFKPKLDNIANFKF